MKSLRQIVIALTLVLSIGLTTANASTLGPGNVITTDQDGSFDMIVVDLTNSGSLAAGSYIAHLFSYQFLPNSAGTITPLLFTGSGGNYTPIAIGNTVLFTGSTGFISTSFGGSNSFSLGAATTVFAGFYWDASVSGDAMPIGFLSSNSPNLSFIRYSAAGGGFGPGANPPVIGVPISGGAGDFVGRVYDFSVDVQSVPEPAALLLLTIGLASLIVAKHSSLAKSQQAESDQ